MRISAVVVYQQVRQLIWHLLACLVLVMVLPLDEAILNFLEGRGFYSERFFVLSMMFSPLLMGLIGCANVQADLNERSYIFWRSKPASTKLFITIKYLVGLIAGSVIVVCPLVFSIVSSRLNFNRSRILGLERLLQL